MTTAGLRYAKRCATTSPRSSPVFTVIIAVMLVFTPAMAFALLFKP